MNLVLLISSLLGATIQGIPQVSTEIKSIVSGITTSLSAIVASGVTTSVNPLTILGALAGVIAALKAIPNLPQNTLSIIGGLDDAITAALQEDAVAKTKVDPTQLQPIAPVA